MNVKSILFLFFFNSIFYSCSSQPADKKSPLNYKVVELYEGTNLGYIPAIIIETEKEFNKEELVSFLVGHTFQNWLAHTKLKKQVRFPWKDSPNQPSSFLVENGEKNPYTNW